jgi:hypothetical protein
MHGAQAGGVTACVTILTAEPAHSDLRGAAASLLCTAARKKPAAVSSAFLCALALHPVMHACAFGRPPLGSPQPAA